jgi:hypothetical protein
MTDSSARSQRLGQIEALQAQGARLIADATDETMKTRVQLAMRDLDDAIRWLNQEDIDREPHLLRIIDTTIDLATRNMAFVANALDDDLSSEWTG